jgi:beta-lactam-binding protein with PASTA domain
MSAPKPAALADAPSTTPVHPPLPEPVLAPNPVSAPDPERTRPATPSPDPIGPQGTRAMTRTRFEAHPIPGNPRGPMPEAGRTELPPLPPGQPQRPADRYSVDRVRSRRKVTIWLLIVLLLAAVAGAVGWWLGVGRWTAVPALIGKSQATAQALMSQAHLTPLFAQQRRNDRPAGEVISTDPGEGSRQLRGATVTVVVSLGRPVVPNITPGADLADAQKQLRDAQLNPVTDDSRNTFDPTVPAGKVLRLDPPGGTPLDVGGTVTILLSKGAEPPKPVNVPSVIGLTRDQAFAKLQQAGFQPFDLPATFSEQADKDHVAGMSPAPGTQIKAGESRRVGVALSNAVTVPRVTGETVGNASNILRGLGLEPDVQQFIGGPNARVLSQDTPPGTRVPTGTRVTIRAF